MFFSKCLALFALIPFCHAVLSGLYVDNGLDQTIAQKVFSRQEKREMQEEILHLLGLPEKPRVTKKGVDGSAPKFLLDVYKSLLDSPSRSTRSEFELTDRDLKSIHESDVIMSLTSRDSSGPTVRHGKGQSLWFDVSEVPPGDGLVGAELRLFQNANYSIPSDYVYSVAVYSVHSLHNKETELRLVDEVKTTPQNEGWLVLNVSGILTSWVAFPESNHGLYLSIKSTHSGLELRPEEIGISSTPLTKGNESADNQPFMVVFLRGGLEPKSRVRRQARHRKRKAEHGDSSYLRNPLLDSPHSHERSQLPTCQIQTLYVSFRDLGWEEWIIAPAGYEAFYCNGECDFPLNAHMNATNHAIVQTLVHLMNPVKVPKPCCAPTKLTAISVLYFVDDNNVMLKKYKNMVVKSCGCH